MWWSVMEGRIAVMKSLPAVVLDVAFALCLIQLSLVASLPLSVATKPIPITVLSGFLGSGKTTVLQQMLKNKEGRRIALIVNDVAEINIDSKLVKNTPQGASGMVELQNGCACCSLSEELLGSVEQLVTMSDIRGEQDAFQHIVIELSGVADPRSIRSKFQEAQLYDMPLMNRVTLDTMVTVVDCSVFLDHLASAKCVNLKDTPELFYTDRDRDASGPQEEEDWMNDMPPRLVEALLSGEFNAVESSSNAVAELIVSQTEVADVVLLNKIDLVDKSVSDMIQEITFAFNPRASVIRTEYGTVPLDMILEAGAGRGVVLAGIVDDHKDSVEAALRSMGDCADPDCSDPRHSHSHSHDHACSDPDCMDESHALSNSHSHTSAEDFSGPDYTDPIHLHSDRPQHSGIGTFIYRARRPFHPQRLVSFLGHLPVKRGVSDMKNGLPIVLSDVTKETLQNVIRSKGFAWCADSHKKALYWSHAGSSFELQCLGSWWATLPRDQWPEEAVSSLLADFDDPGHDEENTTASTVGDRRQELVVIGNGLGEPAKQNAICSGLDQCLLTDSEWDVYQSMKGDEEKTAARFFSPMTLQTATV